MAGFLAAVFLVAPLALATGPDEAVVLDSVTVSGEQPGPGLWRVSRGDHHLWLVGIVSPVPQDMQWRPTELEERLAEAHAVLQSPGVDVGTGRGRLHAITLAPQAIGIRNNPGRQTLADVLPPDTYARWLEQKERYLGRDRKVERWRPIFAAQKLHEAAVEANAMARRSPVSTLVKDTARARGLPEIESTLKITIDDPRDAMREFKATEVEDLACFEATLQRLESDIGLLRGRANAWATGDLDILRELSGADPGSACIQALMGTGMLARRGFDDIERRVHASWLAAAEQALVEYPVTVGAIPMSEALRPEGLLAQLAIRGYTVRAPDDFEDDEDGNEDAGEEVEASVAAAEHPAD